MKLQLPSIVGSLDWGTVVQQRQQRPTHCTRHLSNSFSKTPQRYLQNKISSLIPTLSFTNSCVKQRQFGQQTQNEPGRGKRRWASTIWLWSHSMRASAVESGTWQRSPSLSSASIISSSPRKSSTRCSARRLPMNGEVGDWQSKMPLEYSSALEPAGSKITRGQAQEEGLAHLEAGGCSWEGLSQPNSALVLGEGSSSRNKVGWSSGKGNATTCPWGWGMGWAPTPWDEFPQQKVLPRMEHPLPMPWVTLQALNDPSHIPMMVSSGNHALCFPCRNMLYCSKAPETF